jgi:hypothetical protein
MPPFFEKISEAGDKVCLLYMYLYPAHDRKPKLLALLDSIGLHDLDVFTSGHRGNCEDDQIEYLYPTQYLRISSPNE